MSNTNHYPNQYAYSPSRSSAFSADTGTSFGILLQDARSPHQTRKPLVRQGAARRRSPVSRVLDSTTSDSIPARIHQSPIRAPNKGKRLGKTAAPAKTRLALQQLGRVEARTPDEAKPPSTSVRFIGNRRLPPVRTMTNESSGAIAFSNTEHEGDLDLDLETMPRRNGQRTGRRRPLRQPKAQARPPQPVPPRDDSLSDEALPDGSRGDRAWFDSSSSAVAEDDDAEVVVVAVARRHVDTDSDSDSSGAVRSFAGAGNQQQQQQQQLSLNQSEDHWRRHGLYDGRQQRRRMYEDEVDEYYRGKQGESSFSSASASRTGTSSSSGRSRPDRGDSSASYTETASGSSLEAYSLEMPSGYSSTRTGQALTPVHESPWSTNEGLEDASAAIEKASGEVPGTAEKGFEMRALRWAQSSVEMIFRVFTGVMLSLVLSLAVVAVFAPEMPVFAALVVMLLLTLLTARELWDMTKALDGLADMCTSLAGVGLGGRDASEYARPPRDRGEVDLEKIIRKGVQKNFVRLKLVLVTDAIASFCFGLLLCVTWSIATSAESLGIASLVVGIVIVVLGPVRAVGATHHYRFLSSQLRSRLDPANIDDDLHTSKANPLGDALA